MSIPLSNIQQDPREKLAHDLGFSIYPKDMSADPFLDYIISESPGPRSEEEFLSLVSWIVTYFTKPSQINPAVNTSQGTFSPSISNTQTLESCIKELCDSQELYFSDMMFNTDIRKEYIKDVVLLILGLWTAMKSNFVSLRGGHRPVFLAYHLRHSGTASPVAGATIQEPVDKTLHRLIQGSGLVPGCSEESSLASIQDLALSSDPNVYFPIDFIESLCIPSTALNASKLYSLAGVRIHWTNNISRHLLLSQHAGVYYLELFALPCMLQGGGEKILEKTGIPRQYIAEIQETYANIFNPSSSSIVHDWLGRPLGAYWWCWCLSCSSKRLAKREMGRRKHGSRARGLQGTKTIPFDPYIRELMQRNPVGWDQTLFPHLWKRIVALDTHLQNAKPWNLWVLFRDRREKLPFWTLL